MVQGEKRITDKVDNAIKRCKQENDTEAGTQKHYFFLTWQHPCCHDGDDWVAITDSMEELKKTYYRVLKEPDEDNDRKSLMLMAYEYTEEGFSPIVNLFEEK